MSEFFKGFLSREIVSLTVMLAVLLARLLFRRAPKRLTILSPRALLHLTKRGGILRGLTICSNI